MQGRCLPAAIDQTLGSAPRHSSRLPQPPPPLGFVETSPRPQEDGDVVASAGEIEAGRARALSMSTRGTVSLTADWAFASVMLPIRIARRGVALHLVAFSHYSVKDVDILFAKGET
jgi:hypothetical protein